MRSKIEKIIVRRSGEIYKELLNAVSYTTPHQFVGEVYQRYLQNYPSNPSINGRIFEYLICETLAQSGIVPFYYQAKFERVPNADFDVALYHPTHPVVLTMKVSLRERYKQADSEGLALRKVYQNAANYLITLSEREAKNVVPKIASGDIAGLDKCVMANKPEYDKLISKLKKQKFCLAEPIFPISGTQFPC